MRIFQSGRAPQGSHFLQAFLIPQLYLFSTVWALNRWLDLPWTWYAPYLIVLGLASALISGWMRRRLLPGWRRAYFWLLTAALLYAFNGWFLTGSLALSGPLLMGWIISLALAFFSWWYMAQLRGRARLWAHLRAFQGEELRVRARDYQEDANFTPANRARLIGLTRVLTAVQLALALGLWQEDALLRVGAWLLIQINLESLFRAYRTEMEWFSLGHRIRLQQGLHRAVIVLLLSGLALGLALSITAWVPRYDWNYQQQLPPPRVVADPVPQPRQNIYDLPQVKPELPGWVISLRTWFFPLLGRIMEFIIRWGLPLALGLVIVVPGLRLLAQVRWRPREFVLALRRRWLEFVYFWKKLWAAIRKKSPPEPLIFYPTNREIWLKEFRQAHRTRRKRPDNQLVKGFLLLLDVGQDLQVAYRQGMTTRHYLYLLQAVLPGCGAHLQRLADLMDAGFFRPTPLDSRELAQWRDLLFKVLDAARKARHNRLHDHSTQNQK